MEITIHRSAQEIGGNCIELRSDKGSRLILDAGRPLHATADACGLLPASLNQEQPVDGVLISHPHQDHYGLLNELPADWQVWCGEASARLMALTDRIMGRPAHRPAPRTWCTGLPFMLGDFRITPWLTDHSAFDAHMLLIENDRRRVLYTGDFRQHGRKAALVERTLRCLAGQVDVLIMEGTNLGSDKPTVHEHQLEEEAVDWMQGTRGRLFVTWSAQNVDRTVSLYRACLRAGRTLVVDLYTADVLETLADQGRLPQPGWRQLKVVITRRLARLYRRQGRGDFVERMARHGLAARSLAAQQGRWVVMLRSSLIEDFSRAGAVPESSDRWLWSMWNGYLQDPHARLLAYWFQGAGLRALPWHTSGHASSATLHDFAERLGARQLIPVHGLAWDGPATLPRNITRLRDGESLLV